MDKILELIKKEYERQHTQINLIASENIASKNILKALGSCLTNKYSEGYPNARYYGGCQYIDKIESYTIDLAKKLFDAEYANVQPHCGSSANMAVYFALIQKGDTILSMSLDCGGHLTHGAKVSFSGKDYNIINYGVNKNGLIDYDEVQKLATENKPKLIIAGGSAYSRIIDFKKFREIADSVGAYLMVDMAHFAGLVAAGIYPNPCVYADIVTSTTHKTLRGPRGGLILCKEKFGKQIDKAVFPGIQGGPLQNIIAAKGICFEEAMTPEFKKYQLKIKHLTSYMADYLQYKGIKIVSDGTDSHLFLIDLSSEKITGNQLEKTLQGFNIIVNKNKVPFDKRSAIETSGVRIGLATLSNYKINEQDIEKLSDFIIKVIKKEQIKKSDLDSLRKTQNKIKK
ncbi:MAG: serine hydroxymethyltransferase [Clostridia bacterium]|jgi:glycine hydroxymethyltransferase|nr:serine hydroxymethyltransferase [Clostridia bacterium]